MSYFRCEGCGKRGATAPWELCWWCAGERRLTERQRAYRDAVVALKLPMLPHCDANVLHARGTCRYCSDRRFDRLHALRRELALAYTEAEPEPGEDPCPSLAWRPREQIERWPGNRAAPAS